MARAARDYVANSLREPCVGVSGTGSTAKLFIDEIASIKGRLGGAIASWRQPQGDSQATAFLSSISMMSMP